MAETITANAVATLSDISDILSEKPDPISAKIDGFFSQLPDTQEELGEITETVEFIEKTAMESDARSAKIKRK